MLVIHAMPLRNKYKKKYEQDEAGKLEEDAELPPVTSSPKRTSRAR